MLTLLRVYFCSPIPPFFSEAALPLALENMERFGVPKHIVAFVLPTGYSFNLDGSTLYLSSPRCSSREPPVSTFPLARK